MIVPRAFHALTICALFVGGIISSSASALDEFLKLRAPDAANNDGFGYSAGITIGAAIVGAWKDDDGGLDAGSAYFFHMNGPGSWPQFDKVTASDAAPGDAFGAAVGISGNRAVIGAPFDGGAGSAYVFGNAGMSYDEVDKLVANDAAAGDQFGFSVAISGNTAIVGAWMDGGAGSAYLFRDNGAGAWNQIDKITPLDPAGGQRFGYSVAISGNRAIVGAPFDSEAAALGGATYVFQDDGLGNWNQIDKLTADDASVGAQLGTSVGLSSTMAIAGAIGESSRGLLAGAAYLFEPDGAEWRPIEKLTASDAALNDRFGQAVAISGGLAVVGAYQDNSGGITGGSGYMFRSDSGIWSQIARLTASDKQPGDALGFSAAIGNGIALVGAPLSNGSTDSGAAYLFEPSTELPGDFNNNGVVDAADYTVWRDTLGQSGANLGADGNGDGMVNQFDYQLWKSTFGLQSIAGAATSAGAVPQRSTIALLCLAVIAAAVSRLRQ